MNGPYTHNHIPLHSHILPGYNQKFVPLNQMSSYDIIIIWPAPNQKPDGTMDMHSIPLRSGCYDTISTDSKEPIPGICIFTIPPTISPSDTIRMCHPKSNQPVRAIRVSMSRQDVPEMIPLAMILKSPYEAFASTLSHQPSVLMIPSAVCLHESVEPKQEYHQMAMLLANSWNKPFGCTLFH